MKEKRGGKDKNSVSEEWYDKGFVKDRLMENNKLAGHSFRQHTKIPKLDFSGENLRKKLRHSYRGGKTTYKKPTHKKARGLGGIVGFKKGYKEKKRHLKVLQPDHYCWDETHYCQ